MPGYDCGFLWNTPLPVNLQPTKLSATHLLARWEHERTSACWSHAQVGGPSVIPTAGIQYKLRCLLTRV